MKYSAYVIAALLIIAWSVGVFVFEKGGIIHTFPVIATIIVIMRVIQRNMGPKRYTRYSER